MFTGIVQAKGRIEQLQRHRAGVRMVIRPLDWSYRPEVGDSISVSGCCLTIVAPVERESPRFAFDIIPETLRRTHLGDLATGDLVNLEHAATVGTFLGGHLVQGHVDGLAEVVSVMRPRAGREPGGRPRRRGDSEEWRVRLAVPLPAEMLSDPSAGDLMQYLPPKGSVCIDGVSLTVAALWDETEATGLTLPSRTAGAGRRRGSGAFRLHARRGFEVALIPETLRKTTLGQLRAGDRVNLEVDSIAKTVVNWMRWHAASQASPPPIEPPRGRPAPERRRR